MRSSFPVNRRPDFPRRSKYTRVACIECQRRKSKCSGEDQCALCRKRSVRCVYPIVGRQSISRKPRPAAVGEADHSSSTSFSPSSFPLANMSSNAEDGAGCGDVQAIDPKLIQPGSNEPSHLPPQAPEFPASSSRDKAKARHLEATLRLIAELSSSSLTGSAVPCFPTLESSAANYTSSNMSNLFALGAAERVPENVSLPSLLAATGSLLVPDPNRDRPLSPPPSRRLSPMSVQLPQSRYMRGLFDVCSRQLAIYIPAIDYDEIDSRVIQPISSATNLNDRMLVESRDFLLFSQLYITLALGRCLLGQGQLGQVVSEAWAFYHQSSSLMNGVPPIPTHWVGMAKFHLFRAIYLMQADDLHAALEAIRLSLLFACQAKLNDQSAWPSCGQQQVSSRKRLWWAIYCMERRLSQKCGKPYDFRDEEIVVDDLLTREQLAACQDLEVLPEGISQDDLHLQLLVDISRLWGKIWDMFFRAGRRTSNNDEEIDMMDLRISHLHRNVPMLFRWSDTTLDGITSNSQLGLRISRRLVIYVRYTLLRLLIRQNPSRTEPVSLEKAKFCHAHACEVVDTLAAFIAAYSLQRIASLGYFIATALIECSYHIAKILQNRDCDMEHPAATRMLKKLLGTLKALAPTTKAAERAMSILCPDSTGSHVEGSPLKDSHMSSGSDVPRPEGVGLEADLGSMPADWPGLPSSSSLPPSLGDFLSSATEAGNAALNHFGVETAFGDDSFGMPFPDGGSMNVDDLALPTFFLPDSRLGYLG